MYLCTACDACELYVSGYLNSRRNGVKFVATVRPSTVLRVIVRP